MKEINEYIAPEIEIIKLQANGGNDSLIEPGDGPIDVNKGN